MSAVPAAELRILPLDAIDRARRPTSPKGLLPGAFLVLCLALALTVYTWAWRNADALLPAGLAPIATALWTPPQWQVTATSSPSSKSAPSVSKEKAQISPAPADVQVSSVIAHRLIDQAAESMASGERRSAIASVRDTDSPKLSAKAPVPISTADPIDARIREFAVGTDLPPIVEELPHHDPASQPRATESRAAKAGTTASQELQPRAVEPLTSVTYSVAAPDSDWSLWSNAKSLPRPARLPLRRADQSLSYYVVRAPDSAGVALEKQVEQPTRTEREAAAQQSGIAEAFIEQGILERKAIEQATVEQATVEQSTNMTTAQIAEVQAEDQAVEQVATEQTGTRRSVRPSPGTIRRSPAEDRQQLELAKIATFASRLRFPRGSASLTPAVTRQLDRIFESLFIHQESRVTVTVYTRESESSASNRALARARVEHIVDYLVDRGLDAGRFLTQIDERPISGDAEQRTRFVTR